MDELLLMNFFSIVMESLGLIMFRIKGAVVGSSNRLPSPGTTLVNTTWCLGKVLNLISSLKADRVCVLKYLFIDLSSTYSTYVPKFFLIILMQSFT